MYANHLKNEVARSRGYSDVGDHKNDWEELARDNIGLWLSTKVGRADYADLKRTDRLRPWVEEIAEDLIAQGRIRPCAEEFKTYFELMRAEGEPLLR